MTLDWNSPELLRRARSGDLDALAEGLVDRERSRRFHAGQDGFRLEPMRALWERLGRPLAGRRVVHVAGSKGKGSACSILAALARSHGLRHGLYLSPHVDRWGERVQRDGVETPDSEFGAALAEVLERSADAGPVSFFELLTAGAMLLLEEHAPDLVILETGIGGRLDATNVLPSTTAVLTSVELEHQAILGSTPSEIAREKCGIIKPGASVVSGLRADEAQAVAAECCDEKGARLLQRGRHWELARRGSGWSLAPSAAGSDPDLDGWAGEVFAEPEIGPFGVENAALALRALIAAAPGAPWSVRPAAVRSAVGGLRLRGRCERIADAPAVYRDGAHTPHGVGATVRWLGQRHSAPPVLVLGMAEDKRWRECLEAVVGAIGPLVATRAPGDRALAPGELAGHARGLGLEAVVEEDPRAALRRARDLAGVEGSILITGSFWLLGAVAQEPEGSSDRCRPR